MEKTPQPGYTDTHDLAVTSQLGFRSEASGTKSLDLRHSDCSRNPSFSQAQGSGRATSFIAYWPLLDSDLRKDRTPGERDRGSDGMKTSTLGVSSLLVVIVVIFARSRRDVGEFQLAIAIFDEGESE